MKFICSALLVALATSVSAQTSGKTEVSFSEAFQVDSSSYFMIPRNIDSENKQDFGSGKGYLSWGNYRDIYFYNSATNQVKPLFGEKLAIIASLHERRNYYNNEKINETPANFLPDHIIYLVRTDDFNKDRALDSEDPVYLFISTKAGDNLKQITPSGLNVVSWILSKDKKMILVKLQEDKNGNKKFGNGDDHIYYRIDLFEDITTIKTYPIPLPAH